MKRRSLLLLALLVATHGSPIKARTQTRTLPGTQQNAPVGKPELVLPTGQTGGVNVIAYSPGSETIATAGEDKTVIIWDAKTGRSLRTIRGFTSEVTDLTYSPGGRFLISPGEGVWDANTGEALNLSEDLPADAEVSPDDKFIVGSTEGFVKFWSTATGKEEKSFALGGGYLFSSDYKRLAVGRDDGINVLEVDSGKKINNFSGKNFYLSANGRRLAGWQDTVVKVWDVDTGKEIIAVQFQPQDKSSLAFSPDSKVVAIWRAAELKLWNLETGREINSVRFPRAQDKVMLRFSPDSKVLAVASGVITHPVGALTGLLTSDTWGDVVVRLMDAKTGSEIAAHKTDIREDIRSLTFSPDSRLLAFLYGNRQMLAGFMGKFKVFELATGRESQKIKDNSEEVQALAFSPDGQTLARVSGDGIISIGGIKLWDVKTGDSRVLSSRMSYPFSIDLSPDGRTLASAYMNLNATAGDEDALRGSDINGIRLWDLASDRDTQTFSSAPIGVAFSGSGRLVAGLAAVPGSKNDETKVLLIDTVTGKQTSLLNGQDNANIAFSPDDKTVAASSDWESGEQKTKPEITVWDVASKTKRFSFAGLGPITFSAKGESLIYNEGDSLIFMDVNTRAVRKKIPYAKSVKAMAASPDGKLLAVLEESEEGGTHVIDIAKGVEAYPALPGESATVSFSSDSSKLVAGAHPIKIWDAKTGKELHSFERSAEFLPVVRFGGDNDKFLVCAFPFEKKISLLDSSDGEEIAELISINKKDWLVVTPDGLFDGSPGAWDQILWRFSKNLFDVAPVEAYFSDFYYPGLLADIFSGVRPAAPSDIARKDRRQIPVHINAADKAVASAPVTSRELSIEVVAEEAPARVDAFDKTRRLPPSGAKDIRLFRNGTLVKVWRGEFGKDDGCKTQKGARGQGARRAVCTATVPVVAGDNHFTAYAFNFDNVKSGDAELLIKGAESLRRTGTTHVLSIGINEYEDNPIFGDLSYAEKDAQKFSQEFTARQKSLGHPVNTVPVLYSADATKKNILDGLRKLAGDVKPEDSVVVFYSGHGKATRDKRFYLIPHDVPYDSMEETLRHSISDAELEEAFRGVDAEQILFIIDACNSGQVIEDRRRGPMNSKGLAQLAYDKGMYVLAAAQGYQAASERQELESGLLTYILLGDGLTSKADTEPEDNTITTREWLDYATRAVPNMQREIIERARQKGRSITFVDGVKGDDVNNKLGQTPRVFYRREPEAYPFVVAILTASR